MSVDLGETVDKFYAPLVRRLVEMHGGSVQARSAGKGPDDPAIDVTMASPVGVASSP